MRTVGPVALWPLPLVIVSVRRVARRVLSAGEAIIGTARCDEGGGEGWAAAAAVVAPEDSLRIRSDGKIGAAAAAAGEDKQCTRHVLSAVVVIYEVRDD